MKLTTYRLEPKSLLAQSLWSIHLSFVRVDENVVQVDDDCDINLRKKMLFIIIERLRVALGKPLQAITDHFERAYRVSECSFHCLWLRLGPGGMHVGDRSWCKLVPFVVHLGGPGIEWKQIQVFFENLIESSKIDAKHSEPSFLLIKRTGAHGVSMRD